MGLVFIPLRYGEQSIGRAFGSSISSEESCIQTIRIVGHWDYQLQVLKIFDGNVTQFEEKCVVFRQENVPNAKIPVDAYRFEIFAVKEIFLSLKLCLFLASKSSLSLSLSLYDCFQV